MNFKNTVMYKKGQVGERILDELLLKRGDWIPYHPVFDTAHPFDRLIATPDKRKLSLLEVKTISARNAKPEYRITGYPDTGISIAHYNEYKYISNAYRLAVFIAFVDALNKEIYGNYLKNLDKLTIVYHRGRKLQYPLRQKNFSAVGGEIIYFPLRNMRREIAKLTDIQSQEIEQYSNYGYKKDIRWKDSA